MKSELKNMNKKNKNDTYTLLFLVINFILAIFSVIRNLILHYHGFLKPGLFADHIWIYRECAYAIRGLDMSEAIKTGTTLKGIPLEPASSTWPWAKVLGIIVHGAFLGEKASCIYAVFFYAILICIACLLICRKMLGNNGTDGDIIYKLQVIFLFLSSWYYVYLAIAFNNGSFVCLAIIIAITLIDDDPVIAGIIMAFAMIKAQIAIPFFVVFLIRKKWKVIWTSVSIVVFSWITCCIMTHITPWQQIINLLTGQMNGSSADFLRFGMFDFILLFDNSKALISMVLSAITGLILLVFIELKYMNNDIKQNYTYLSYYDAAIVSMLWMYTTKCDYLILTLVALGILEMWYKSGKDLSAFVFCIGIMACSLMNLTNLLGQFLAISGIIDKSMAQPLEGRFDTVMLLILLAVITYRINNSDRMLYSRKNLRK